MKGITDIGNVFLYVNLCNVASHRTNTPEYVRM